MDPCGFRPRSTTRSARWRSWPAEEISIAEVIRELEGPIATVRGVRPDELAYEGAAEGLRNVWLELRTQIRGVLEQTTLADLTKS
jgi:DNA-binding IscR family transcriptional regulator